MHRMHSKRIGVEKKISLSMKALLPQEDETDAEEVEETTEE